MLSIFLNMWIKKYLVCPFIKRVLNKGDITDYSTHYSTHLWKNIVLNKMWFNLIMWTFKAEGLINVGKLLTRKSPRSGFIY